MNPGGPDSFVFLMFLRRIHLAGSGFIRLRPDSFRGAEVLQFPAFLSLIRLQASRLSWGTEMVPAVMSPHRADSDSGCGFIWRDPDSDSSGGFRFGRRIQIRAADSDSGRGFIRALPDSDASGGFRFGRRIQIGPADSEPSGGFLRALLDSSATMPIQIRGADSSGYCRIHPQAKSGSRRFGCIECMQQIFIRVGSSCCVTPS